MAEFIAVDTETYDPRLNEAGPGFIRGDARVCGISIATDCGKNFYLPIGHREGNLDKRKVVEYLKKELGRPGQAKVFANAMYDLEALWSLGIDVRGTIHDIQIAEPVLDEDRDGGYSLEALSKTYLGYGKDEQLLKEAEIAYGVEHKKGMHELPACHVGPYAEIDADNTLQVFLLQQEELLADEVMDIYQLETQLLPVLFKMRLNGVRVDLDKADILSKKIALEETELQNYLFKLAGCQFSTSSSADMEDILIGRGLTVPRTAADGPSVTNEWLEKHSKDDFCKGLVKLRKTKKMRCDFIDGFIIDLNVKGRLHTQWHQLRDYDDEAGRSKGTRSGRIASSKPNLTQIPARDPYWGPLIRSLFIADEGGFWTKADYSQQEPRILLHFAYLMKLAGAAEARQRYIDDPDTDYHQLVADLIHERAGLDIGRKRAKGINLGSAYGMGKHKMAAQLGVSLEVAEELLKAYHEGVPYVKLLETACIDRVHQRGSIKTILGRKRRFKEWEPTEWHRKMGTRPVKSKEEAERLWGKGQVSRAHAHKALNSLVQGSAADQIKKALIMMDAEGIPPSIQIYDELNATYFDHKQVRRMQEIMENAIPEFTVPFTAAPDMGRSWGEVKAYKWTGAEYALAA
jgi:DNA polymerase I-like protein with 3'-5' exonuclease and polymerase domains